MESGTKTAVVCMELGSNVEGMDEGDVDFQAVQNVVS